MRFREACLSAAANVPSVPGMADHYEQQYLDLMRHVWTHGDERTDRTGVGTRAIFGAAMRFSLADDAVPLLTTKRVYWKTAAREFLWFLAGGTNIRPLLQQKVRIWSDWPLDRYRRQTGEDIAQDAFEQRIVEDEGFAERWGDLMAQARRSGIALSVMDGFFAATALARELVLATRNTKDFAPLGVPLFNPWIDESAPA